MEGNAQSFRRGERGFTLIELLVVIVILGVLSAVVVFAVRGVGDKGKSAAVTTDEKTIRTAEEAYCAQKGTYATGDELVEGGFLSEIPSYHQVNAQASGGTCNGWRFFINRKAQAGDYPLGRWDLVAPPAIGATSFMVRLADGQVLAGGFSPDRTVVLAQIWDPSTNMWTSQDNIPESATQKFATPSVTGNTAVLLSDDPGTPQSDCSNGTVDNCGKVFVHGIALFNPRARPGTQWESLPVVPDCNVCSRNAVGNFTYLQLKTKNGPCGAACGKIFMWAQNQASSSQMDIFDPRSNSYSPLPYSMNPDIPYLSQYGATRDYAIQMPDGRIFLCCTDGAGPASAFLDPITLDYTLGPTPDREWVRDYESPALLPNGDLLLTQDATGPLPYVSSTYKPQRADAGQFGSAVPCGTGSADFGNCRTIGSLPDGRVLSIKSTSSVQAQPDSSVYVYNPVTRRYDATGNLNRRDSFLYSAVLLDPAGGRCGGYCGKMLVAGNQSAEVYSP